MRRGAVYRRDGYATPHRPRLAPIKNTSVGTALTQELKKLLPRPVELIPVDRDKFGRLCVHQAKFEAGLALLPEGAPFLPELETELLSFPQPQHDDQVDSITQALSHQMSGYDSSLGWVG